MKIKDVYSTVYHLGQLGTFGLRDLISFKTPLKISSKDPSFLPQCKAICAVQYTKRKSFVRDSHTQTNLDTDTETNF